ncbi:glycosyltransferase family A protein [Mesorhizobium sp. ZMM04-5]|uniref:Glycosyltransferase family A protein n=1 Tax=Mesorhizobium marinum TaxID=3228790 RepID=A0ABV3R726_9HYPH
MKPCYIIITASHNRPNLLVRNIQYMLNQSYENWLQIIVDDSSSEDMTEVFNFIDNDRRIHLIQFEFNKGCNAARNRALDFIEEQGLDGFICIVDDDDYIVPDALQKMNNLIISNPGYRWYTADSCFPDGKKACQMKKYGRLSYLQNRVFSNDIKGDLTHFIDAGICKGVRFTDKFRNAHEWSFFSKLSFEHELFAFEENITIKEYLEGGLTKLRVSHQNPLKVRQFRVDTLSKLVSKRQLSSEQLLLSKELIKNGQTKLALSILKSIAPYQMFTLKFYRYLIRASLLSKRYTRR